MAMADDSASIAAAFTHCALHVRDVEASIAFYRRFCGLEAVNAHGQGDQQTVWLCHPQGQPPFVLVLVPGGGHRRQTGDDLTHYGFAVKDRAAVDQIAAAGRAAGCLYWEPQELGYPAGYICALSDPDGYVVEFSCDQPLGPFAA